MTGVAYKRYVLVMLSLACMLSYLDSCLIALLLQSIKGDLGLSDTQLGVLTGIATGLFYATLGVPMSRLADRSNRSTITAIALGVWGLVVMAHVFVTSFVQLLTVRMAVAVGDAGVRPPTYSLLGDYFPEPAERAMAMAVYWSAGSVAALISYAAGGWLNDVYGWRTTLLLMSIPGFVIALLVKLTVVDPRSSLVRGSDAQAELLPLKHVWLVMWHRRSTRHLTLAMIAFQMMLVGLTPWFASFLIRSHGMTTGDLGIWLGVISGCGGLAGGLLGGYVAGRWFADDERAQLRLSAIMVACLAPCAALFLLLPQRSHALAALVPFMIMLSFFSGPTFALLQRLVEERMRATSLAIIMLLSTLIGVGLGPLIVGVVSDVLAPALGAESLRYSMLMASLVAFWSASHFWLAGRTVREDLRAMAESGQPGHAPALGVGSQVA